MSGRNDENGREFGMHGEYREIDRTERIVHTIAFRENTKLEARNPNGAIGRSDIEGKAARVAASERGQRTSFKQIQITNDPPTPDGAAGRMNKRRPFRIFFFEHLVIVSDFELRISNL
jgi:hypothetical protein